MNERLLDIMEQWFWSILGVLLLVFTGISFITGNLMYMVVCLVALIVLVLLGMFVFEIFEHMIENQIEDEDEDEEL